MGNNGKQLHAIPRITYHSEQLGLNHYRSRYVHVRLLYVNKRHNNNELHTKVIRHLSSLTLH